MEKAEKEEVCETNDYKQKNWNYKGMTSLKNQKVQ
jgi:hypothetical protein